MTAYIWDMFGGGFPYETLQVEMRGLGVPVPVPPSLGVSRIKVLRDIWVGAGLVAVETQTISAPQRTFADFDDYWTTVLGGPSVGPGLAAMTAENLRLLQSADGAARALPTDAAGRITYSARAIAVKGRGCGIMSKIQMHT